jgi:hypothetical protein
MKGKKVKNPGSTALRLVQRWFPKTKTVQDATESMMLDVLPDDEKTGARKDSATCAFAQACRRKFRAQGVIVGLKTVYLILGDTAYRYKVAESVSREIVSFDRSKQFDAGKYKLRAPQGCDRLDAIRSQPHSKIPVNKREKNFRHYTGNVRASILHG